MTRRAVVTGAFSYIGSAAARWLRDKGFSVHTLTNRAAPPGSRFTSAALRFDPEYLERELRGADVFVNTYWVRLRARGIGFDTAVDNSRMLVEAAQRAGVRRLVHVSVSNADERSPLGYYRGKGEVERIVRDSGLPYSIVRPTLVVGSKDVLTSNIAWLLRRLPIFLVPASGTCRLQPITLGDAGRIIAEAAEAADDETIDAAGPEVWAFRDYVRLIAKACGVRRWIIAAPRALSLFAARTAGLVLRDTVLTREELDGLAEERLVSREPPRGAESVAWWLMAHGKRLGRTYVNDMDRHFGEGRTVPIRAPR
jgi:uncharacterized protein YbjT (DUF2867 family)